MFPPGHLDLDHCCWTPSLTIWTVHRNPLKTVGKTYVSTSTYSFEILLTGAYSLRHHRNANELITEKAPPGQVLVDLAKHHAGHVRHATHSERAQSRLARRNLLATGNKSALLTGAPNESHKASKETRENHW